LILCALKLCYPEKVWLLRGNHETESLARSFQFEKECRIKFNQELFRKFVELFNWLPLAGVIENQTLGNFFLCSWRNWS